MCVLLYVFQSRLVYFPPRTISVTPAEMGLKYEEVTLETSDGVKLSAWYVPAPEAVGAVMICHGNAENLSDGVPRLRAFHRLGLSVLLFDYRGYGSSEGSPDEEGTYLDARAAWDHLVDTRGFAPERITVLGCSLGGGVASWLATQVPPRALVLESTFTSIPDLASRWFFFLPIRQICRFSYDTRSRLPRITCPVLIVHSHDDALVPFSHGEQLHAAAVGPKQFLPIHGGHADGFLTSGRTYEEGLAAFLRECALPDG